MVGRINHQYSSADYAPIHYMTHSVEGRGGSLSLSLSLCVCVFVLTFGILDEEICALYSIANAQLITSLRGGMPSTVCPSSSFSSAPDIKFSTNAINLSLQALEYIICQREQHGMLILSEFTGVRNAGKDQTALKYC